MDQEGRFELKTQTAERAEGAVIGTHRVKVYSRNAETPVTDTDTQQSPELVPPKYNISTQLMFDVPPEGSDDADFHLKVE